VLAALWGCPKREAKERCTAREFYEWVAYYRMNPWGEERADLRTGIVCALTANVHRGKNGKAYKPTDFLPKYNERRKVQSGIEMAARMKAFATAHNSRRGKHG